MKSLVLSLLSIFVLQAQAESIVTIEALELPVTSCEANDIKLEDAIELRTFGQGNTRVFVTDKIEPAAAAYGVAIVVQRGQDLSDLKVDCRFVGGLTYATLAKIVSFYDAEYNALELRVPGVRVMNDSGEFKSATLALIIRRNAKTVSSLVSAYLL